MNSRFLKSTVAAAAVAACAALAPSVSWSQVSVSINIGPPPLPVYEQPLIPGPGYLWTPGYWAWDANVGDYYWVPGTWVQAPMVGYLWTPGYWAFETGRYLWHGGYWADHVGFYGGIDYGYGYTGHGYWGGRWDHGVFAYNRAVNNVNTTVVRNFYNQTVVNNINVTRVSYNGQGGVVARPTAEEARVQTLRHVAATQTQVQQERLALAAPSQRAQVNHGVPQVAATPRPAMFTAPGVVHAANAPTTVAREAPHATPAAHPAPVAPAQRPVPPPPNVAARSAATPAERPQVAQVPQAAHPVAPPAAHAPVPPPPHVAAAATPPHPQPAPRAVERPAPTLPPLEARRGEQVAHAQPQPQPRPQPEHAAPPRARPEPQPQHEQPHEQPQKGRDEH